jgi:hypothetical protein
VEFAGRVLLHRSSSEGNARSHRDELVDSRLLIAEFVFARTAKSVSPALDLLDAHTFAPQRAGAC